MALKLANAESGGGKKGKLGGPNKQVNTFPSNILYMSGFSGMGTLNLRKEKKRLNHGRNVNCREMTL